MASFLAIFILFFVPVAFIVLFWLVHILPEKIAHQRHHPQFEAIRTLCLLSLVFGGLLWPLAWLWAYTKPVGYKLAYGTDKRPDINEHGRSRRRPRPSGSACRVNEWRPGRARSRSRGAGGPPGAAVRRRSEVV